MKKIYITLFLSCFIGAAFAQSGAIAPYSGKTRFVPKWVGEKHHAPSIQKRGVTSFYLDYEALESDFSGTQYQVFYDVMNVNFSSVPDTFSKDWIAVGFDTIIDYTTLQSYDYSTINSITIDSIFWRMGHVNHSGQNDTLHIRVVALDAHGDPTETNIWDTMFIANQSFTGLALNMLPAFGLKTNITVTPPNAFGIRLDYSGAKEDSCSFIFGFTNGGTFGQCNYSAYRGLTWPTSYYFFNYAPLENMWPRNGGNNFLYRDCNNNNQYDGPTDPEDDLNENFSIWAYVTIDYQGVGIDEAKSDIHFDLYPNPASDVLNLDIATQDLDDYTVAITNLQGQVVYSESFNKGSDLLHQIDISNLPNGIYMLKINDGHSVAADRFVVNR